jgi:hypothetical protein
LRSARLPREIIYRFIPEGPPQLGRRNWLVLSGADPRIYHVLKSALFEAIYQHIKAAEGALLPGRARWCRPRGRRTGARGEERRQRRHDWRERILSGWSLSRLSLGRLSLRRLRLCAKGRADHFIKKSHFELLPKGRRMRELIVRPCVAMQIRTNPEHGRDVTCGGLGASSENRC